MSIRQYSSAALEISTQLKTSPGRIYKIFGLNDNASERFIQVHDAVITPSGGSVPTLVFAVPANSTYEIDFGTGEPMGWKLNNGIFIGNSTTAASWTAGGADNLFQVIYI